MANQEELDAVEALRDEGLIPGLLAIGALLRDQSHHGQRRWERLTMSQLLDHLHGHARLTNENPSAIDGDSGHHNTAHTATRALMVLTRIVR